MGQSFQTLTKNLVSLKDLFRTLYDNSMDGMILMKNHKFIDFNPALVKMFGFDSKEQLLDTDIKLLMPKYQQDGILSLKKMMQMSKKTFQNGSNSFEFQFYKKDKTILWCDIVLTKIDTKNDTVLYGIYRDITAKKELENIKEHFQNELKKQVEQEVEKNRQKDRMMMQQSRLAQMGEMISMIAHQWRQPLSALSSANSTIILKLQLGTLDKQTGLELTSNISKYISHLSSTIDDFRGFFKDDKKKNNITLVEVVKETLNIVNMSLSNANIKIIANFNSTLLIQTYTNELKQVILNLIKNAEDALIEKQIVNPTITIDVVDNIIIIQDNAGGIPHNIMDKIFQPYFSTKINKDGTGLGLYMSKTIIEDHCDGKLEVTNTKNGAMFKIVL